MAVSRRLRLRGEMERLFSRSLRNAATNGASISSKVSREGGLCRRFSVNRNRRRNVSRYEAMVCVLACFCCSKRWVKKPSNKPGKLDVLFIAESSNASLTSQRPVPSVLDKPSDTSRYRLDGRVRDKWKEPEDAARHRRRSHTSAKVSESRIDDESRAGEVHGYRTHPAGPSAATKHGTFGGRCSSPIEFLVG